MIQVIMAKSKEETRSRIEYIRITRGHPYLVRVRQAKEGRMGDA